MRYPLFLRRAARAALSSGYLVMLAAFSLACSSRPSTPADEPKTPANQSEASPEEQVLGALAPQEPATRMPVEADDARLGSSRAAVTVVAFLDFQCSFCARGFAALEELRDSYDDDELRIVFKHLPLDSHPMAVPAAVAGQAVQQTAGSRVFFDFARKVFENQGQLGYQELGRWAVDVGVPRNVYDETVGREETVRRVAADVMLARKVGVDGTPAFFVNGRALRGLHEVEALTEVVDEELAAWRRAKSSGAEWKKAYADRVDSNMSLGLVDALLARDPHDYRVPVADSATWGDPLAPVTIVEFSDYQCPYCKRAEDTIEALRTRYAGRIRIVFKHLPLPFHPQARPAARLAEAVRRAQGDDAFFEVSHELFEASPDLDRKSLLRIGARFDLAEPTLGPILDGQDEDIEARLRRDEELASDVEAQGTPHFFINGKRLAGARPFEHFEALIESELKRASRLVAEGVQPSQIYETLQLDAIQPGAPTRVETLPELDGQPVRGPEDAPVTIHVFSDFECPYCRRGEQTLRELEGKYPDQLRFVWHDFPLPFHDAARPAARAAREALARGGNEAFWKLHDAIFGLDGESPRLEKGEILEQAEEIGLDRSAIESAMTSGRHDPAINSDLAEAQTLGIDGTPAFIVGGYLLRGARPLRDFERLVELALEKGSD